MSKITGNFKLTIHANDTAIAESSDTELCLKVLEAISKNENFSTIENSPKGKTHQVLPDLVESDQKGAVAEMAQKIEVDLKELIGACAPQIEPPYLTLDHTYWESLRANTGLRGPSSVAPIVLALTLLNIWFDTAKLGKPTQKMGQEVLKTLHITDANPSRGVKGCKWLQQRPDKTVIVNPAKYSSALALARQYITQSNE